MSQDINEVYFNYDELRCRNLNLPDPRSSFGYSVVSPDYELLAHNEEARKLLVESSNLDIPVGSKIMRKFFTKFEEVAIMREDGWDIDPNLDSTRVGRITLPDRGTATGKDIDWVPSINAEFVARRAGRYATTSLSKYGKQYKEQVKDQISNFTELNRSWMELIEPLCKDRIRLRYDFVIVFNKLMNKRDVSNTYKLTEDAIADYLGVNDSWNYEVNGSKYFTEDPAEQVFVRVEALRIV